MDFYFTDRKFNLLGIASASNDAPISIYNDQDVLKYSALPLERSRARLFRTKNER